jgi:hypothetical protein
MTYEQLRARTLLYVEQRAAAYRQGITALARRKEPMPGIADAALADLARFCRAHGTCFGETDRDTYVLIGRKQVFDRITEHLHLSPERLLELYSGHTPPTIEDE